MAPHVKYRSHWHSLLCELGETPSFPFAPISLTDICLTCTWLKRSETVACHNSQFACLGICRERPVIEMLADFMAHASATAGPSAAVISRAAYQSVSEHTNCPGLGLPSSHQRFMPSNVTAEKQKRGNSFTWFWFLHKSYPKRAQLSLYLSTSASDYVKKA